MIPGTVFCQTAQDPHSFLLQLISVDSKMFPSRDSTSAEVDIKTKRAGNLLHKKTQKIQNDRQTMTR